MFDKSKYIAINEARWRLAQRVIRELRRQSISFETAYDFGSGPGWFADKLLRENLDVIALEGRQEIVDEGQRRVPDAQFQQFDLDAMALSDVLPQRDFSLAFGILYHLENPLRALRIMSTMTSSVMLLETMVVPGDYEIGRVVRENPNETQGIQPLAIILSIKAVTRGLWATKMPHVYLHTGDIDHPDFQDTTERHPRRAIWLASREQVDIGGFEKLEMEEPKRADYWRK